MKEEEEDAGKKTRKCELGKRNVLAPLNVSLKPRQLLTWQMRGRRGAVDPQVDHLYVTHSKKNTSNTLVYLLNKTSSAS